jgi:CBS domain-containing protein
MTTATKRRGADNDAVTAKDIMERRIVTVSPSAPLSEVERLLTENRISGMPVTDAQGRAIGVVSYRDLLDHYAENPDARPRRERAFYRLSTQHLLDEDFESFEVPEESEDTVEDVMTPEVIGVGPDATLREIARTMSSHSIHRVLVVERESGKVVGIISSMGVLAALSA